MSQLFQLTRRAVAESDEEGVGGRECDERDEASAGNGRDRSRRTSSHNILSECSGAVSGRQGHIRKPLRTLLLFYYPQKNIYTFFERDE